MAKIEAPKRSEAQWQKLYNAYLRQQSKLSEELSGNVYSTLSMAEFKGNYNSLWMGGVRQNITRTLVQRSARVSYRKARIFTNMIKNIKKEIEENKTPTPQELAILQTFNAYGGKIKDIRRNPILADAIDEYYQLTKARREQMGEEFDSGYEEWIDGSP